MTNRRYKGGVSAVVAKTLDQKNEIVVKQKSVVELSRQLINPAAAGVLMAKEVTTEDFALRQLESLVDRSIQKNVPTIIQAETAPQFKAVTDKLDFLTNSLMAAGVIKPAPPNVIAPAPSKPAPPKKGSRTGVPDV